MLQIIRCKRWEVLGDRKCDWVMYYSTIQDGQYGLSEFCNKWDTDCPYCELCECAPVITSKKKKKGRT